MNFEVIRDISEEIEIMEPGEPSRKEINTAFERTRIKRNEENHYVSLVSQHTKEDSSIPVNFLGLIRSK